VWCADRSDENGMELPFFGMETLAGVPRLRLHVFLPFIERLFVTR
jgi:hypothetical protein